MAAYPVKKAASDLNPPYSLREGLAVTDCLFMCSRDGEKFTRYSEAFMTSGIETTNNWVYGDCYPGYGLLDFSEYKGKAVRLRFRMQDAKLYSMFFGE